MYALIHCHRSISLTFCRFLLFALLSLVRWLFSADKWVCILYQILIWNFLLAISQDALSDYMKSVAHQAFFVNEAGFYCVEIIQSDVLNSIQFFFDYVIS